MTNYEYIKKLNTYDLATLLYCVFRDTDAGIIDIDGSRMLDTIGDVVDWLETERTEKQ